MKFSILVPVFNVEKYISQCIESVLAQQYDDYELILTNDGSTDSSPEICERYAKQDARIKYFSKKNEGLLLTRRYALKRATGEYILFLDSDDYWKPNLLETVANELKTNPVDMLLYRFDRVRDNGELIYSDQGIFDDHTLFIGQGKEAFLKEFVSSSRLNTMWSKCVKRTILDVDYDYSKFTDKKGEDLLQSMNLIKNAESILYLDASLYCYRLSPAGRGRNFKKKYIDDYEVVRTYVLATLIDINASKEVINAFYLYYYLGMVGYFRRCVIACSDYRDYKQTVTNALEMETCAKAMEQIQINALSGADRIEFALLKKRRFWGMYWKNKLILEVRNRGKRLLDVLKR